MEKLLQTLMKNTPLALVAIGLFLFLIGAAGGWERYSLRINEFGWRVTLAAMGAVLAMYGSLLIWRPRSSEPELDGERLKELCNLTIQTWELIERGYPNNQYILKGKYERRPPLGRSVWLITASMSSAKYWPQSEVVFDNTRMEWHSMVGLGAATRPNEEMRVILAILGDCGEILFKYYSGTRDKQNPDAKLPLPKLPRDVIECVSVVLDKRQIASA